MEFRMPPPLEVGLGGRPPPEPPPMKFPMVLKMLPLLLDPGNGGRPPPKALSAIEAATEGPGGPSEPAMAETRPSSPGISVFSDIASQLLNREIN